MGTGATDGSSRVVSSTTDGSRQPLRPPTALLRQRKQTLAHVSLSACGDFSHTKPVSLSSTAWLLNAAKTTNRWLAGSF